MSMNKEFFNRVTNISVKILKDSVSETGYRMTSFELEYPRFLHCELLTHRDLSRNCSSSRAIPIASMVKYTEDNMAIPVYWGKKKRGMQATEEVDSELAQNLWLEAYQSAVQSLKKMDDADLHKQIANRIIEPFQMMKVVVTATDLENFWNLRFHQDTLPEFVYLVQKMYVAMQENTPQLLRAGEWHLPYVEISTTDNPEDTYYFIYEEDEDGKEYEKVVSLEDAKTISSGRCAVVSYRTQNVKGDRAKSISGDMSESAVVHASPFEHQGTPMKASQWSMDGSSDVNLVDDVETWEEGITHMMRTGDLCSGNLTGFIQHRHLIKNNTCWDFDFESRYQDF